MNNILTIDYDNLEDLINKYDIYYDNNKKELFFKV